jgi:hypothetical protein
MFHLRIAVVASKSHPENLADLQCNKRKTGEMEPRLEVRKKTLGSKTRQHSQLPKLLQGTLRPKQSFVTPNDVIGEPT